MRFFENKNIFQKITIAILIVTLFSFIFSNTVRAGADEVLIKPIVTLLNALGDGIMDLTHLILLEQSDSALRINIRNGDDKSLKDTLFDVGVGILITLGVAIAIIATAGVALASSAVVLSLITGATKLTAVVVTGCIVFGALSSTLSDQIVLPLYNVTPEMIFSGRMAIFDVDFFNPNEEEKEVNTKYVGNYNLVTTISGKSAVVNFLRTRKVQIKEEDLDISHAESGGGFKSEYEYGYYIKLTDDYIVAWKQDWGTTLGGDISYDIYLKESLEENKTKKVSIAYNLSDTIANWYVTLRNIALVGGLTILVYIGIRIILSSSSADKSKYKQRILDWIVSMCLIFVMHYIMAGSNLVVRKISNVLNAIDDNQLKSITLYTFEKDDELKRAKTAIENNAEKIYAAGLFNKDENGGIAFNAEQMMKNLFPDDLGGKTLKWPSSQMGGLRMMAQKSHDETTMIYFGYGIMFLMLVFLTVIFAITYFKRIIYMAFLTLIAPLVAMTYSLDKLKDGKAQGFNMWFREYIINLIIQPIHLLLYTVLIYSALDIAKDNPLYGIIALGFLIPAEKIVRKFFGVPSTETQGFLSGPAETALAMTGLHSLLGHRPPSRNEKETEDKDAIRFKKESLDTDNLFDSDASPTGSLPPVSTPTRRISTGGNSIGESRTKTETGDESQQSTENEEKQARIDRYKKDPNYEKLKAAMKAAHKYSNEKEAMKANATNGSGTLGGTPTGGTSTGGVPVGSTSTGSATGRPEAEWKGRFGEASKRAKRWFWKHAWSY